MVKSKLRCGLCLFFHKECHKETVDASEACEEFKLAKIFYCSTRGCFMDTVACAAIIKNKREGKGGKELSPQNYATIYSMCLKSCVDGNIIEARLNQMLSKQIKFVRRGDLSAIVGEIKSKKSKFKIVRRGSCN